MGLVTGDGKRVVMLHHGHFVEAAYHAMSSLTAALEGRSDLSWDAETLERLNANWIDFLWSNDGDDGRLGAEIMRAHDAEVTGGHDVRFNHRLAAILADKLGGALPLPRSATTQQLAGIAAKALADALDAALKATAGDWSAFTKAAAAGYLDKQSFIVDRLRAGDGCGTGGISR